MVGVGTLLVRWSARDGAGSAAGFADANLAHGSPASITATSTVVDAMVYSVWNYDKGSRDDDSRVLRNQ